MQYHRYEEVSDMGKEERNTYTIQEEEIGQVQIADEVVAIIPVLRRWKWTGCPPWQAHLREISSASLERRISPRE